MSQDKRQTLDDMLAGVFREPPPLSRNTERSPPTSFDEEPADQDRLQALDSMLVEVFRAPPLISTKTESSPTIISDQPSNEELADQTPIALLWAAFRDLSHVQTLLAPCVITQIYCGWI